MRDIPGFDSNIFARATSLAPRARSMRDALPDIDGPRASMAPAKVRGTTASVRLYDVIDPDGGYWGISDTEFADVLDQLGDDITDLELHINSPGGSVWAGLAIMNDLRQADLHVKAIVTGVAASAASFIAVACDEVVMMPNSRLMIHDALGICLGQANDMRAYATFLDDTSDNIAAIYASKAGGTVESWRATMQEKGFNGQWYSAADAVTAGLVDSVGGEEEPQDRAPVAKAAEAPGPDEAAAGGPVPTPRLLAARHRASARRHGLTI